MHPAKKYIALLALLAALPLTVQAETRMQHDVASRLGSSMAFATIDSQSSTQSFSMHGDMVDAPRAQLVSDPNMMFDDGSTTPPPPPVVQSTPIVVPDDPGLKSASPGPAQSALGGRAPELPQPSVHDVRQELWKEWAEKFQLLQDENTALREKLRNVQGDGLQDIRVDSVAEIERQALKSRIADLEKEVEQLRGKKTPAIGPGDGLTPLSNNGASPLARTHAD